MHFQIHVEDASGKVMLNNLVPRIIGPEHSFDIKSYKGIGHLPKGQKPNTGAGSRILLDQLPRLISGFGKTWASQSLLDKNVLIIVCDLDNKNLETFLKDLNQLLERCEVRPKTRFCIAIEEGEAWLLGDIPAIIKAYPKANEKILKKYKNDSICGTWELLANAVYRGGLEKLKEQGRQEIGSQKSQWAEAITPYMDIGNNKSPSFQRFVQNMREIMKTK